MNITFCTCCGEEVSRHIQPNAHWRTNEGLIVVMCKTCRDKTNDFVVSLLKDITEFKAPFDLPEDDAEDGCNEDCN